MCYEVLFAILKKNHTKKNKASSVWQPVQLPVIMELAYKAMFPLAQ